MEKAKKGGLIKKTLDRRRSAVRKPEGYFTVYVGEGRQRFMVRTECVNHPLFRPLLDEAEQAFGLAADGPVVLPCDAYAFLRVLEQIDEDRDAGMAICCGLVRSHSTSRLLGLGRPVVAWGPRRALANRQLSLISVRTGWGC